MYLQAEFMWILHGVVMVSLNYSNVRDSGMISPSPIEPITIMTRLIFFHGGWRAACFEAAPRRTAITHGASGHRSRTLIIKYIFNHTSSSSSSLSAQEARGRVSDPVVVARQQVGEEKPGKLSQTQTQHQTCRLTLEPRTTAGAPSVPLTWEGRCSLDLRSVRRR